MFEHAVSAKSLKEACKIVKGRGCQFPALVETPSDGFLAVVTATGRVKETIFPGH